MKVNIAVKIARQVEGEFVFIQPIMAFIEEKNMQDYLKAVTFMPAETIDGAHCLIEVAVLPDVEVGDIGQFFNKES